MCQVKASGIVPTSNEIKDNLKVINKIGYLEELGKYKNFIKRK